MRKIIFSLFLASILFSCKDTAEKKLVKSSGTAKDTVSKTVAEKENNIEEEEFKNEFNILIPQNYRTFNNQNPVKALNEKWVELYKENEDYFLGKPNYKIEKGYSECSGDSVLSIIPEKKVVLLMDYPQLKTGKIKSLKIDIDKIWPKEKLSFVFNNVNYTLRGEGKVLSEEKINTDDDKIEIFKKVEDYKLYLTVGNNPEKLLLTENSFNDTFVEMLFAGDIDGDGKLDFIFGANRDYEEDRALLFLSSKAENGEAVKKVSEIAVQFDC
ncbi:hypothetical protein [Flavobacterium sp.]|uniref:hypothetical protein n=1 Tax=Flavobacterium sp. TaxID=239 RepID=UPI0031DF55BF